jgi:uncharacterized protein YkwD
MRSNCKHAAVLAALMLAAIPAPAAASSCAGANIPASVTQDPATRATLTCLINAQRAAHGLRPLATSGRLAAAAAAYSNRMVAERFFAHVDPHGGTITSRAKASGYTNGAYLWALGENLAWGVGSRALPSSIVAVWMASPGHRANLLEPTWREIGVGVAKGIPLGGTAGATYAAEFGQRSGSTARRSASTHRKAVKLHRHKA